MKHFRFLFFLYILLTCNISGFAKNLFLIRAKKINYFSAIQNTSDFTNTNSSAPATNSSFVASGTDVKALPLLLISEPTLVCVGSSINLNASEALTYTLSNNANSGSIFVSPSGNTGFTVTATGIKGCNVSTETKPINNRKYYLKKAKM